MFKLIILLLVVAIVDLKKLNLKHQKKEVLIYIGMILVIIGLNIYHSDISNKSILEFIMDLVK